MKYKSNDIYRLVGRDYDLIYYVPGGDLVATTPKDALKLMTCFTLYLRGCMDFKDANIFEQYLYRVLKFIPRQIKFSSDEGLDTEKHLSRLEIMLATTCNLSCKYCYASSGTYGKRKMLFQPNKLLDALSNIIPNQYDEIDTVFFFGGEPLLNLDGIIHTCQFFKMMHNENKIKKIPRYTTVSNGVLIDDAAASALAKYDIQITISIDGPPFINDVLRVDKNGKGTYKAICEGIRHLKTANANLSMFEATYTNLHNQYGWSCADIKRYLKKEFGEINILVANCTGDTRYAIPVSSELSRLKRKSDYAHVLARLQEETYRDYMCDAGLQSMVITPDVKYYPCHMFVSFDEYSFTNTSTYLTVKKRIYSARKENITFCRNCWARNLCQTCPASWLLFSPEDDLEKKQHCNWMRNLIKEILFDISKEDFYDDIKKIKELC